MFLAAAPIRETVNCRPCGDCIFIAGRQTAAVLPHWQRHASVGTLYVKDFELSKAVVFEAVTPLPLYVLR